MIEIETNTVYVAFGGNLGNLYETLAGSLRDIASYATGELLCSSIWQSAPVDMDEDAPDFLNGVVCFTTALAPMELLKALQALEIKSGRPRDHGVNQSRTLDLDILCFGDKRIDEAELQIPHPRMAERLFVLLPLQEIAPDFVIPGQRLNLHQLIEKAPKFPIRRVLLPQEQALLLARFSQ